MNEWASAVNNNGNMQEKCSDVIWRRSALTSCGSPGGRGRPWLPLRQHRCVDRSGGTQSGGTLPATFTRLTRQTKPCWSSVESDVSRNVGDSFSFNNFSIRDKWSHSFYFLLFHFLLCSNAVCHVLWREWAVFCLSSLSRTKTSLIMPMACFNKTFFFNLITV